MTVLGGAIRSERRVDTMSPSAGAVPESVSGATAAWRF